MTAARAAASSTRGIEQLVDRVLLVGFEEPEPPDWLRRAAPGLGAVILYGPNFRVDSDAARIAAILRSAGDVLLSVDEEGGDVTRLHYRGGSPTPGNQVLGRADDVALTTAVAGRIGAGLRTAGVLFNLAPVVDVNANPDNPVVGVRSFGADPDVVSRHARAWIDGLQAHRVAACAKHFPGHGDTSADSHLELPVVGCDEREWRRVHLPPFVAAIEAGVQAVMTAHVQIPALDRLPATVSRRILGDLLRGELGYQGLIVTDALDMGGITSGGGSAAAAVAALAAGADALCLGAEGGEAYYRQIREAVVEAVRVGDLPLARVADAAERVDRLHAWTSRSGADGPQAAGGDDPGLVAARRAAIARDVRPLAAAPVVVELRVMPNLAVGEAAWDLTGPLRDLGHPPVAVFRLSGPDDPVDGVIAGAAGHPLVVVGRDVARHPWQAELWHRLRAGRDDAVLVELGLPRPDALTDGPYVLVGGAGRPNVRVAAEILAHGSTGPRPDRPDGVR